MPHMSEMMTHMYMDIVIKEYNDPQPSTIQEYDTSPNTARPYLPSTKATKDLELVKKLQAEIALLEEMKKRQSEKGLSTTMRTAVEEVRNSDDCEMHEATDDDGRESWSCADRRIR